MNSLIETSILYHSDSYKVCHWNAYLPGTEKIVSYLESRGSEFSKETLISLLEPFCSEFLEGKLINSIDEIDEAREFYKEHFIGHDYFPYEGWKYILEEHDGYLPLKIKAVPDGTVLSTNNVIATIENTDQNFSRKFTNAYWLTNYIESIFLQNWYPITVGSVSFKVKQTLWKFLKETSDYDRDFLINNVLPYQLHDFGLRGATGVESASRGGAANIFNFLGTDNVPAMRYIKAAYESNEYFPGYSVYATEHSVMTAGGPDGELDVFENILRKNPTGILSIVIDSFNLKRFIDVIVRSKKNEILSRSVGPYGTPARIVFRPDSGDPIVTNVKIFELLADIFGYTTNKSGYKVLHDSVRIIQGDGVNSKMIEEFLSHMKNLGFASENWVFGMGGALLQKDINRDTFKFAVKCCVQVRNGNIFEIEKNPLEYDDRGNLIQSFKKSKKGFLKLIQEDGVYKTVKQEDLGADILEVIFENGKRKKRSSIKTMVDNLNNKFI